MALIFVLVLLGVTSDQLRCEPATVAADAQALSQSGGASAFATPFATPWAEDTGGASQSRLIAELPNGVAYTAAVEIKLGPQAITYWRQPGDAGVPPEFSFAGSDNLATAAVLYPAPMRLSEDGLEAFGYRQAVTFPIKLRAQDATKPVRLVVTLNYAVCDKICLPAKAHAELLLPRRGNDRERGGIAAAEAEVPVALDAADTAKQVSVQAEAGGEAMGETDQPARWTVLWQGAMPAIDLFAEAPKGWTFATRKIAPDKFSLAAVERPTQAGDVAVHLTLTGKDKSYEFAVPLHVGAVDKAAR